MEAGGVRGCPPCVLMDAYKKVGRGGGLSMLATCCSIGYAKEGDGVTV